MASPHFGKSRCPVSRHFWSHGVQRNQLKAAEGAATTPDIAGAIPAGTKDVMRVVFFDIEATDLGGNYGRLLCCSFVDLETGKVETFAGTGSGGRGGT